MIVAMVGLTKNRRNPIITEVEAACVMSWLWFNVKQLRGLLINNVHLQLRQYKSNIIQLLLPVICMVYVRLLQWMYDEVVDNLDLDSEIRHHQQAPWMAVPLFGDPFGSALTAVGYYFNQTPDMIPQDVWYYVPENNPYGLDRLGEIDHNVFIYRDPITHQPGASTTQPPVLFQYNSTGEIDLSLYHLMLRYRKNNSIPVLGAYNIRNWTKQHIDYVVQYDFVKAAASDPRNALFSSATDDVSHFCKELQLLGNSRGCQNLIVSGLMNEVNSRFSQDLVGITILTNVQQMPYEEKPYEMHLNLKEILAPFFFPLMLNLLLPVFMYKLVLEKKNKLKEMMKLSGMNYVNYVASNVLYMVVFYAGMVIFFSLVGGPGFKYRFLTQTHWMLLFLVFFGACCTIIAMAHFLSALIWDEMLAIIIGYFYVLFLPVIGVVLNYYVMKDGVWGWKPALLLETLPISDAVFHLSEGCLTMHCEMSFSALWENKDFLVALIVMYVAAFIYFILGLYLDQVMPQEWGKRKNPLFCFMCCLRPCFDKCRKDDEFELVHDPDEDVDVMLLRERIMTGEVDEDDRAVLVKGIVKRFKGNTAVNGVYFGVERNEIFGLLGPNGAGKTTLIRCLVGLYDQTDGDAYLAGHSVSQEMHMIRRSLGYCPQFDIFWNDLTVRQTLLFFARLKGVPISEETAHVERIMRATGLYRESNVSNKCWAFCRSIIDFFWPLEKQVMHLSGGMKRRLSIGISLCGDPDVVILDEPTTGLDPTTKRQIWNIILKEKETKSVLITTHSMEEADVLSDKIGIMSKGNLVCCGSSLALKARYGTGYTLEVNYQSNRVVVVDFISSILAPYRSRVIKEFGDSITWEVSPSQEEGTPNRVRVSDLFDQIRRNEEAVGIADFQLNQTTLEDVFLNVIEKAEQAEIEEEKKNSGLTEEDEIPSDEPRPETPMLSSRTPLIQQDEALAEQDEFEIASERTVVDRLIDWLGFKDCFFQTWYLLKKNFRLSYRAWPASIGICLSPLISIFCIFLLAFIVVKNDVILHPLAEDAPFHRCHQWGNAPCYSLLYSPQGNDFGAGVMNHVIGELGLEADEVKRFDFCKDMTNWIEANVNRTGIGVCFTNMTETDQFTVNYTLYFNDTTVDMNEGDSSLVLRPMQLAIDNAIIYMKRIEMGEDDVPLRAIETQFKRLPTLQSLHDGQGVVFSAVGPNLFSLTTMLLLVVALQKLVSEKEKGLKEGMSVIGMRHCPYFCSWMIVFVIFAFCMSVVVLVGGCAFVIYPFIYGNQFVIFMLFFLFNLSLVCLAFALSSFLRTVRAAIVVGFIVFAITCILNQFLANGNLIAMFSDRNAPPAISIFLEVLWPCWNFGKALSDIIRVTTRSYDPVSKTWTVPAGFHFSDLTREEIEVYDFGLEFHTPPTIYSFYFLVLNCFICLMIHLFAEQIGFAIRQGRTLLFWIDKCRGKEIDDSVFVDMDEDVRREYDDVHDEDCVDAVRLMDLQKTYHVIGGRSTKAVSRCSLGVPRRCCLALLGHNGAGKSTVIQLICGTRGTSGGDVRVCGTSIHRDLAFIRKIIGVCFQEDILFDNLTAAEHLRLFGELKGLSREDLSREIEFRLRQVSLWHVRDGLSKTFSGGMKRRLSVAIACISSPTILLLDEPTTGMDPYSKREVWELIFRLKARKSILLTTHSMEEADALSDKIAIMTNGDLKCVGNSLHLKGKFGSCYILKLLAKTGFEDRLESLLNEYQVAELVLQDEIASGNGSPKTRTSAKMKFVPNDFDKLSAFLPILEDEMEDEEAGCIKAFGLTHTTLEDVYVSVTKREDMGFVSTLPRSPTIVDEDDSVYGGVGDSTSPEYQRVTEVTREDKLSIN